MPAPMAEPPSGTVTFLFTDLEGSTRLWEEHPAAMQAALARHDVLIRQAIDVHGGHLVKSTGDGVHAAFATAAEAVGAAIEAQQKLTAEHWAATGELRVRMGIHTGAAEVRDGDYYGTALNRAARLTGLAHGGQIVLSGVTAALVADGLTPDVELTPLGAHRLRDVAEALDVFQVSAPGIGSVFPPLQSLDARPGNLPARVSSFVGRAADVDEVAALVADARLVTLTGVGGVGKTRLALEVAARVVTRYRDGTWIVELARLRDPTEVPQMVAGALRAPQRRDLSPLDALSQYLAAKEILVVLDNCEHLLEPAAELVRHVLATCPRVTVLATSREGLAVPGERMIAVRSLAADDAAILFDERARAVKADFAPNAGDAEAITELCRRLDGIPLAIELAAARVPTLNPAQIAQRLDRRFRLLAGGERGAVERHATLRAAIDWSFELLGADEQLALARLSVFAGGCTLEAAEAVVADGDQIEADDVLDLLSSLVNQSLVVVDASFDEPTYRLLETIRQYAEEHLGQDDAISTRDRHARYYADFLDQLRPRLQGREQLAWLPRADREQENFRAAIAWALERREADLATELFLRADFDPFWFLSASLPIYGADQPVVELARSVDHPELAKVLGQASWCAASRGEIELASEEADEAWTLAGEAGILARMSVWSARESMAIRAGDLGRALECHVEVVAGARKVSAPCELANFLAMQAAMHGPADNALAVADAMEALTIARSTGTVLTVPVALSSLAVATMESDPDAARAYLFEAIDTMASFGDVPVHDGGLILLLIVAARLGEDAVARTLGDRAIRQTMNTEFNYVLVFEGVAVAIADSAPEHAAALFGAVDTRMPGLGDGGLLVPARRRGTEAVSRALEVDVNARRREAGALMTLAELCDHARDGIAAANSR